MLTKTPPMRHFSIMASNRFKIRRKECEESRRKRFFINTCMLSFVWCQILFPANANASTISVPTEITPTQAAIAEVKTTVVDDSTYRVQMAELVRNLSAVPHSHDSGNLQLKVSWVRPQSGKLPDDYTITVHPKNSGKCTSKPCYEYHINRTEESWYVPPSISGVHGAQCSIKPGCTYNVSVRSNPWDGKSEVTSEITIPECVDKICSCHHGPFLPKPNVSVIANMETVNVSWALPPAATTTSINIAYFKISIGESKVISPNHVSWFHHNGYKRVNFSDCQWTEFNISNPHNESYEARVIVVDTKECSGPIGNRTFKFKAEEEEKPPDNSYQIIILITVVVIFVLFGLIFAIMTRRRMRGATPCCVKLLLASARADQTLRRQHAWPPGLAFTEDRQMTLCADHRRLEERCPLYVEKEIEEARISGKADNWEISPNRIHYGSLIGEGAFGRVYIARLDLPGHPIAAVKKLKDNASPDETGEFLSEIAMLKLVGQHRHVVALVACCTLRQPYCAVLEFAERGDLLGHLRELRSNYHRLSSSSGFSPSPSSQGLRIPAARPSVADTEYTMLESELSGPVSYVPNGPRVSITETAAQTEAKAAIRALRVGCLSDTTGMSLESDAFGGSSIISEDISNTIHSPELVLDPKELHSYALQIAKGMEHLEKKGITHRDLAARNVLIDGKGKLKISDLGLSRAGVYVTNNRMKVPLRWLALEAIRSSLYSSKSDVWSYAVLLWEIGTLGGFPYAQLNDHQILGFLSEGRRLDKPEIVTVELYATMIRCWAEKPEQRPSFSELVNLLDTDESKNKAYVDIASLQTTLFFPPMEENPALISEKSSFFNLESRKLLAGINT